MARLRGFTLIEVTVLVAVLAILAGTLLPVISRPYVADYRVQTLAEMRAIQRAILGDPANGDYGFVGTMGRVPRSTALTELWLKPDDMNAVSLSDTTGVLNGWNGPYLRTALHRPEKDAWGHDYLIEGTGSDDGKWRIRSYGPDGTPNTSDDIVLAKGNGVAADFLDSRATVKVYLLLSDGQHIKPVSETVLANAVLPTATEVEFYKASATDASEEEVACTVDAASSTATCNDVPFGLRHFRISSTANLFPTADVNVPVLRPVSEARIYLDPSVTAAYPDSYEIPVVAPSGTTFPLVVADGGADVVGTANVPNGLPVRHALEVHAYGSVTPQSATTACTASIYVNGTAVDSVTVQTGSAVAATVPFNLVANKNHPNATALERAVLPSIVTIEVKMEASGGTCTVAAPVSTGFGEKLGMVLPYVVQ
jgi:type II secretory pathway pseudopilin PulG